MCRGFSPSATYPVAIKPVPKVFFLAAFPVVPLVLGGLAPVGGGGAGSLGSLVLVIWGDHREAVLHEELVVVCQPENLAAAIPTTKEVKFLLRLPSR